MWYSEQIRPHRRVNLSLIKSPALLNVDANLPVVDEKIAEDAKRMEGYSDLIEKYSEYTGLVLVGQRAESLICGRSLVTNPFAGAETS